MVPHLVRIPPAPVPWLLRGRLSGVVGGPLCTPTSYGTVWAPYTRPTSWGALSGRLREAEGVTSLRCLHSRHFTARLQAQQARMNIRPLPELHLLPPRLPERQDYRATVIDPEKSNSGFLRPQERGPGRPLTAAPFHWPPADSTLVPGLAVPALVSMVLIGAAVGGGDTECSVRGSSRSLAGPPLPEMGFSRL